MSCNYANNKVTEQGFGTPEPVGCGSGRAGSLRPLASDRSIQLVGDQASVATGTINEGEPFRKQGIPRTPPCRERLFSFTDVVCGLSQDEQVAERGENAQILIAKVKQLEEEEQTTLDKLGKDIMAINSIVKEARNIHKTIRDHITSAVINYQRIQRCRVTLRAARTDELKRGEGNLKQTVQTEMCDRETQISPRPPKTTEDKKRIARSPLEETSRERKIKKHDVQVETKMTPIQGSDNDENGGKEPERENEWVKVAPRQEAKKRKEIIQDDKRVPKKRRPPEAVAVKMKTMSYVEALKTIKGKVDPESLGVKVSGIRQTRGGEILIQIKSGSAGGLRDTIAETLGEEATVRTMNKITALDIRDLDGTVEEEEIITAIKSVVGDADPETIKMRMLRKDFGETQFAIVTMSSRAAELVLKAGRLKIGWILCRVRERAQVTRCYRCLGFGHMARECTGPDHTQTCRLCGKDGHIAKHCTEKPFCIVCSRHGKSAEHILGSKSCESFRKELMKATQ